MSWYVNLLSLLLLIGYTEADCILSNSTLLCKNVEPKEIETEIYRKKSQGYEVMAVELHDSKFDTVNIFLENLDQSSKDKIQVVRVINSGIVNVDDNAFSEYGNLKILDLTNNKIENTLFIKSLPTTINELILRDNNINHLEEVFTNLKDLRIIDLSFCKLDNFSFAIFKENLNLDLVNVSNNNMQTSETKEFLKNIKCVDISNNNLTKYDNIPSFCLDFSHTYIPGYRWFNVSEKNATVFVDRFYYIGNSQLSINATNVHNNLLDIEIGYLNISEFKSNLTELRLTKVKVVKELILSGSNIFILDRTIYDFQPLFYRNRFEVYFDLSNCSINDISETYFEKYNLGRLNLCYNNITNLRSSVFLDAQIYELDLCHCNIETIESNTFKNFIVKKLDLSNNNLNTLNYFGKVNSLEHLDLSFNKIQFISANTFLNLADLEILDLSNNLLDSFDGNVFVLPKIRILNLRNNKLLTIKSLSFNNIPNLSQILLDGNDILIIEADAFTSLPNLKTLCLNDMGINSLQAGAFRNLQCLEAIYLNNNNISVLPQNLFVEVPNLRNLYLQQNYLSSLLALNKLNLDLLQVSINDKILVGNFMIPQLKYLYITDSSIETLNQFYFSGLYNLRELYFKDSNIVFIEPGALDGLFNLQFISPQLFKQTTILKKHTFRDLKVITSLDLSGLTVEVIEPEAFVGLDGLQTLLLNNNKIIALNDYACSGLNNVIVLDLSQNCISQLQVKSLEGLKNVRTLLLNQNNVSMIPIGVFQNLGVLDNLDLARNQITSINVGTFSNLQNLKTLDLSFNRLRSICSGVLYPLGNLERLNLEGNLLTTMDTVVVLEYLPNLNFIGINNNNLNCGNVAQMLYNFKDKNISMLPLDGQGYETQNINGIICRSKCGI